MYNLLGNRKMLPVPYGPVGSMGLAVLCGATVVGGRLHVAVRHSTKKCQCAMQDLRVLAHAVGHHYVQPHILCCRPRPSSMPIFIFVGVLMARGERLRAPPSSLALFFSTTSAGGLDTSVRRRKWTTALVCTAESNEMRKEQYRIKVVEFWQ